MTSAAPPRGRIPAGLLSVLAMVVLLGMGERLAERFLPLYIMALGGGAVAIGALNGMDNLLSALYSFPGGYLSDRLGHKRALLIFNLIAIFGYLIVIVFPVWQAVLVGAVFFISWSAISLPATMSVIATVLPARRQTVGVSMHSLVRRVPMALGPLLGGLLIVRYGEVTGVRIAFTLAILFGLLALVFQQRMLDEPPAETPRGQSNLRVVFAALPPALRRLLVSDILVRFCEQIPYAFVVVWAVTIHGITPAQFGVLTTIEMATAVLVYLPVAALADRTTKKPFVLITFGFFTVFPLILLFSRTFGWLVVAFIVRGLKEFGEPARKSLIMDLAPEGMKASGFGLYYLMRDSVVSLAAFGGAFLWLASPQVNFLTAFAFGLLGMVFFAVFARE
ncbi:MAG: MFS transporter [Anaerolineae bacterium]|nr:MAG: MFS transporter [Anaerolineae bacterium]